MLRVVIAIALCACYAAPDYRGTGFKCDDDHGCPPGQECVGGFCGGSGSGEPDGAVETSISCAAATCADGMKCCVDFITAPYCVANGTACPGVEAKCDGIEDCGGSPCCIVDNSHIACGTTCAEQACRDMADCTNPSRSQCCLDVNPSEPWGRCLPACP